VELLSACVDATPVVRRGCREEGRQAGEGQGVPLVEQKGLRVG
jgi:hypothetical protein